MAFSLNFLFFKAQKPRRSSKRRRQLSLESLENRRVLAALPYGATEADLGEFMLGTVGVTPVFFESNGQLDTSSEDWTPAHISEVLGNIDEGLDWWVDLLATQSSVHELSFTLDTTYATTPVETKYEPIARRSNDYSLYVTEFLTSAGFTSGNIETDIRSFNQAQREKLGTDWSYTMFVIPSENDTDGNFASGGSFSRAFAFAGGLFMVVPSTRPASTFAHETGHIFWARDEYLGGSSSFAKRGYYNTSNDNSADNPTPGFVQQPSIMASSTLLDTAYENYISPASTLAMLGWQDSDQDGIFDVLDVPHRLTGTGYLDSSDGIYHFQGNATVQTLANQNPAGLGNDITLNRIREIEYRFDVGEWQIYSTPDAYEVALEMSIPVPSGVTQIEIRARDSKTTVASNLFTGQLSRADATLTPGINGSVWIDANGNGLRDTSEFGREGWQIDLVDNLGQSVPLKTTIEPDNYPDGTLTSNFNPQLTLAAVGTDTDGRVGVFADSSTSTGSKNFRLFSRSSNTYQALWNDSSRQLQATFSVPTTRVTIDGIAAGDGAIGRMDAYNSNGQLIGRYTTANMDDGQFETMTIESAAADIAWVTIGGHAGTRVRLDNLSFGPESSTTTDALGLFQFPALPEGDYQVRVTPLGNYQSLASEDATRTASVLASEITTGVDFGFQTSASSWQNPTNRLDVNNDSFVSPIDALLIINELNSERGGGLLTGTDVPFSPFLDVDGDEFVAPIDVLLVINHLNSQNA
ncbi:dockerin type I domain-containing protein [Aureliella helgolandensis]|uniref:Protein containing Planctomycete extracellular domain protein n=1 Tax=Aureliella helgolandensis TaxID=2527968 RepID=A0A518GFK5_9BACT|nr:dockerin type I domain-containing protein [Aureliella helgolandensis]QDV27340.1 hypothetical protein Q31a_57280 [Aureliella helgolandensis]